MWKRIGALIAMAFLLQIATPARAPAASLERLVMPGDVIQGHAKFEDVCETCHEPFSKARQSDLCRACHKSVSADIERKRGFHGLDTGVRGTACKHCHTDHKGRDAEIVGLDRDTFDHRATDFPVGGAHTKVPCAGCHAPEARYRDAPSRCVACHKKDEPHLNRLGPDCAGCHSEATWTDARFDHAKTRFPLQARHRGVSCKACHPDERYTPTPTDCYSCHRLNDIHAGRFGPKCARCHTPEDWKPRGFSHGRDTKFALTGKHRNTACHTCHTAAFADARLDTRCASCHRQDDVHKGRNGPQCRTCHTADDWARTTFDHDRDTKFRLRGRHAKVLCGACHRAPVHERKLKTACVACHRVDDTHKGVNGDRCEKCHTVDNWAQTTFDHGRHTRFPLRGRHAKVKCVDCHSTPVDGHQKTETACYACHKADDTHAGQQGTGCQRCHNEKGWAVDVFFDHDLTRFALVGLHGVTPCEECHLGGTYKDTTTDCLGCHRADDEHKGGLGVRCGQCHNPNGWRFWHFDHDAETTFKLDDAHRDLQCRACHRDPVQGDIVLPTACYGCHRQDDVHRGRFGQVCGRCHAATSFRDIRMPR